MRWTRRRRALAGLAVLVVALLVVTVVVIARSGGQDTPRASGPTGTAPAAAPANVPDAGADGAGDPYYPQDGNGGYDVADYAVSISYDPASKHLDGDTTLTAITTQRLARYDLDLLGYDVSSVEVNGAAASFTRTGEHELVITPATPLGNGARFTTRVRYAGTPSAGENAQLGQNGWQISRSGGAFAAGEPHSALTWYPVNDTPRDKATFHLAARVPTGWSVISNGREDPSTEDGGWTTYHWSENTRIASYLTTVGIDHWTFTRSALADGTPLVDAYAPGAEGKKADESRLPEILEFLSSKFGPYPQDAAGSIWLNENIQFSLETQTRPTFATWAGLTVIVHENAHQWFGDSVSVRSWADICLNECFASYAQWLWDEAKEGVDLDQRYRGQVAGGGRLFASKLYDMGPGNEFGAVYTKGPVAVHALRRQIGDQAFDALLHQWTTQHKDGNASWTQFEQLAAQVSGQDLSGFFQAWFHSADKPADQYLYPGSLHS